MYWSWIPGSPAWLSWNRVYSKSDTRFQDLLSIPSLSLSKPEDRRHTYYLFFVGDSLWSVLKLDTWFQDSVPNPSLSLTLMKPGLYSVPGFILLSYWKGLVFAVNIMVRIGSDTFRCWPSSIHFSSLSFMKLIPSVKALSWVWNRMIGNLLSYWKGHLFAANIMVTIGIGTWQILQFKI